LRGAYHKLHLLFYHARVGARRRGGYCHPTFRPVACWNQPNVPPDTAYHGCQVAAERRFGRAGLPERSSFPRAAALPIRFRGRAGGERRQLFVGSSDDKMYGAAFFLYYLLAGGRTLRNQAHVYAAATQLCRASRMDVVPRLRAVVAKGEQDLWIIWILRKKSR
jgi:hypothetical protein